MGSFDQLYHYCKVLKHQVLGPFNLSRSPKDADFQPVTSENHRNPVTVTKSMKQNPAKYPHHHNGEHFPKVPQGIPRPSLQEKQNKTNDPMKNTLLSFLQNAKSSVVTTKAMQITQIFALQLYTVLQIHGA